MTFNNFFNEWKQKYKIVNFNADGIVSSKDYNKGKHVLFVLRDKNDSKEGDLCADLLKDGSGWKTWNNVGRWTKALLDADENYPRDMSRQKRIEQLKRIAVMNLKKECGGNRTNGDELKKAVEKQWHEIRKEIEMCDPDIIVCCGLSANHIESTANLLNEYVLNHSEELPSIPSKTFKRDWKCWVVGINGKRVPFIEFCHPQVTRLEKARGHDALFEPLYRDMLSIRQELEKWVGENGDNRKANVHKEGL